MAGCCERRAVATAFDGQIHPFLLFGSFWPPGGFGAQVHGLVASRVADGATMYKAIRRRVDTNGDRVVDAVAVATPLDLMGSPAARGPCAALFGRTAKVTAATAFIAAATRTTRVTTAIALAIVVAPSRRLRRCGGMGWDFLHGEHSHGPVGGGLELPVVGQDVDGFVEQLGQGPRSQAPQVADRDGHSVVPGNLAGTSENVPAVVAAVVAPASRSLPHCGDIGWNVRHDAHSHGHAGGERECRVVGQGLAGFPEPSSSHIHIHVCQVADGDDHGVVPDDIAGASENVAVGLVPFIPSADGMPGGIHESLTARST